MDFKQIVWLASYPKSGNTWVRCFLDAYFMGSVDINEILMSVSDDNGKRITLSEGIDLLSQKIEICIMGRLTGLLNLVGQWGDKQTVPLFVKTHNANIGANGQELIPRHLTKAVVYLVRDPRDVLPSFAAHMGIPINDAIECMTDRHRVLDGRKQGKLPDVISSWEQHVRSYLYNDDPERNILLVRYEDLKKEPVEGFAKILSHAGVEPDRERIKVALDVVSLSKLREQEVANGFTEKSYKQETEFFGGKRPKANDIQRAKVARKFGAEMRKLGYDAPKRKAA